MLPIWVESISLRRRIYARAVHGRADYQDADGTCSRPVGAKVCRRYGIGDATSNKWPSRYGGGRPFRRVKALEDENRGKTSDAELAGACCDLRDRREELIAVASLWPDRDASEDLSLCLQATQGRCPPEQAEGAGAPAATVRLMPPRPTAGPRRHQDQPRKALPAVQAVAVERAQTWQSQTGARHPHAPGDFAAAQSARSIDSVADTLASRRRFRILIVVDAFTKECLARGGHLPYGLAGRSRARSHRRTARLPLVVSDNRAHLERHSGLATRARRRMALHQVGQRFIGRPASYRTIMLHHAVRFHACSKRLSENRPARAIFAT
jgi:hypothetical protein